MKALDGWLGDGIDFEIPNTSFDMDVVHVGVKIGVYSSAFDLILSAPYVDLLMIFCCSIFARRSVPVPGSEPGVPSFVIFGRSSLVDGRWASVHFDVLRTISST